MLRLVSRLEDGQNYGLRAMQRHQCLRRSGKVSDGFESSGRRGPRLSEIRNDRRRKLLVGFWLHRATSICMISQEHQSGSPGTNNFQPQAQYCAALAQGVSWLLLGIFVAIYGGFRQRADRIT